MRLFRMLIIAMVCLVVVPRVVAAQVTNRVSITTAVGFDNVYFADSWTPVRITIDDIPIDMPVTIEWVVTADSQPTITWQRALALQAGTPVTIDTVMVMPSSARSIIARVRSSEGIIASTQIDAQVAVGQLNVIVADQTTLATTFTSTVSVDGSTPVVRTIRADALPTNIIALQGVNTILISDSIVLTDAQLRTLRLWCELGGRLVIAGPAGALLSPIAPFVIDPTLPAVTTLGSAAAPALPSTVRIPAVRALPDATQVHAGSPLLWQRAVGRGTVYQSALALADSDGWSGQYWYWQPVLAPSTYTYMATITLPSTNSVFDPLMTSLTVASVQQPTPWLLFLIALVYIGIIGPVTYLILKRRNQLDAAWVTIPATAVVYALLIIGSVYLSRGTTPQVYGLRIVQQTADSQDGYATTTSGVYAPFRTTFVAQATGVTSMQKLSFTSDTVAVTSDGTDTSTLNLAADVGSMQFVTTSEYVPAPLSVSTALKTTPDLLHGTIRIAGQPLSDAYLQIGSFAQSLGTITPGVDVPIAITQDSPSFPCDIPSPAGHMVSMQAVYERITGPCGAVNQPLERRAVLYGWTPVSGNMPDISGLPYADQRQLVVVTIVLP